jgi:hypothetical protein
VADHQHSDAVFAQALQHPLSCQATMAVAATPRA